MLLQHNRTGDAVAKKYIPVFEDRLFLGEKNFCSIICTFALLFLSIASFSPKAYAAIVTDDAIMRSFEAALQNQNQTAPAEKKELNAVVQPQQEKTTPTTPEKPFIATQKMERPNPQPTNVAQPLEIKEQPPTIKEVSIPKKIPALADDNVFASNTEKMTNGQSSRPLLDLLERKTTQLPLDLSVSANQKADIQAPLHLEEAVAFALKNNFEVQAAGARVNSSKWDRWSAYGQYAPSVEYTYAQGAERSRPGSYNDGNGNRVVDTTHFRRDRELTISQPLIDLSIVTDILKSKSNLDLSQDNQLDKKEEIAFNTIKAYLHILQARLEIDLYNEYMGYLEDLSARMKARVEGGGATKADLDRIHSRLMRADAARIESVSTYGTNFSEFQRLTKITPATLEIPETLIPSTPRSANDALLFASKKNPSYLASLAKIKTAEADRNKTASGALPKLSVQYTKNTVYDAGGIAHGNPIDGVFPTQSDDKVMLVAKWTFAGGTLVSGSLSGTEKMKEMNLLAQDVLSRLDQSINTGYSALTSSQKRVVMLQDAVQSDEQVVKGFEDQYAQGSRSLFELLDSRERLHTGKIELMRTLIAQSLAAYQIRQQMGDLGAAVLQDQGG